MFYQCKGLPSLTCFIRSVFISSLALFSRLPCRSYLRSRLATFGISGEVKNVNVEICKKYIPYSLFLEIWRVVNGDSGMEKERRKQGSTRGPGDLGGGQRAESNI